MTIDEFEIITEQPRTWTEFCRSCARAEIWTDNGHRIDGANSGAHADIGITIARPADIPNRIGKRHLMKLYITVSSEDRQTVKRISANYGIWPEEVTIHHDY